MSLLEQAAADAEAILSDPAGFTVPVTVESPDGRTASLRGSSADISSTVDPDTGAIIVGSVAHVALPIRLLTAAGLQVPTGSPDPELPPWRVTFTLLGVTRTMTIREAIPDRTVGVVVLILTPLASL